ncbi:MAG: ROK family protein [Rhodobacteraceae bacterium]|nr:ROK family protein [Paracoccaceae bacterium]
MAPNIQGIDSFNFAEESSNELGVVVQVENDVNLAVFGEHWAGCSADVDDLVYLAIGTGVGAGLMIDGNLVRGAIGSAGELGFLPFGADPFDSASLKVGAFERAAGSIGLMARYKELAGAIASICAVVNPSLVIVGGSIGLHFELFDRIIPPVEARFPYPTKIVRSELGEQAALIGRAAVGLSDRTRDELREALWDVEKIVASYSIALKIFLMEIHSGSEEAIIAEAQRMAVEDAKIDANEQRACQYAIEDANYWLSGVLADHSRGHGG